MSDHWIQVGQTDYFCKSDRLNWIVARRLKCEKSKSFPDGHKLADYTYHDGLSSAFKRIFDETIKLSEAETIQDILRVCEETYAMLKRALTYDFSESETSRLKASDRCLERRNRFSRPPGTVRGNECPHTTQGKESEAE